MFVRDFANSAMNMLSYAKLNNSEWTHVGCSFIFITTGPCSLPVCHTTLSQANLSISWSSGTTSARCSDPYPLSNTYSSVAVRTPTNCASGKPAVL